LPIGGFVRIKGENAEDVTEDGLISDDSFTAKSKWAQAAVLIAGVTMNVLFAWMLFVAVFISGLPTSVDETSATDAADLTVIQVINDAPAANVGIPLGATLVEVSSEGTVLGSLTPTAFQLFTQQHGNADITIIYNYKNEETEVVVTPQIGLIPNDDKKAAIGVALSLVETVQLSPIAAMIEATKTTITSLGAIAVGITSLAVDSIKGTADFSGVAGPIGIVGLVGDAAEFGITSLLMFTAIISLNLAVINMLPFPALDGGRLVIVGIEAVRKKPINPVWVGRVNLIGFVLLLLLMVAVTYNDLIKIF
jgi:regulator of sigma E protease